VAFGSPFGRPFGTPISSAIGRPVGIRRIAYDSFNRANQELSTSPSDSGHTWAQVAGVINIASNEADVATAPAQYALDSFVRQPKEVAIDVKDTNATDQILVISIRDAGDGLNYVELRIALSSAFANLTIDEYVGGVSATKAQQLVFTDFRDETIFHQVAAVDNGGSITVSAASIDPSLTVTWSAAGSAASKGIGLLADAGRTAAFFDNIEIKG